jgi:hypothetical protein
MGYWYRITFTGIDATTTISCCTVNSMMQSIKDIWDGSDRQIAAFYAYFGTPATYNDATLNVRDNGYDVGTPATYIDVGGLKAGTEFLIGGFTERMTAWIINIIGGYVNTTAGTKMTIYFSSDGVNWTAEADIDDGTSQEGISMAKSGTVLCSAPDIEDEFTSKVSREYPLYHYKIAFDKVLSAGVRIYYIAGIPAQKKLSRYNFPLMAQDRLLLLGDKKGKKNSGIYSTVGTSSQFNGQDSGDIDFEDLDELTAGCTLFSQFWGTLYNLSLIFSRNAFAVFSGTIPDTQKHLVSAVDGCPAPHTLKVISLPKSPGDQSANRSVAIWQGTSGIYISDGKAPVPVHNDIKNFFDSNLPECITPEMLERSEAFVDEKRFRYHFAFASGAGQTTLNKEMILNYQDWKWFEADRGTARILQGGLLVHDKYGNPYPYGFVEDTTNHVGYVERLEHGKTFDGNDIACEVELGDFLMADNDPMVETRVQYLNILLVAKEVAPNNYLVYAHTVDAAVAATSFNVSMSKPGRRMKSAFVPANSEIGIFHSGKLTVVSSLEDIPCEILALGYYYTKERDHLREV